MTSLGDVMVTLPAAAAIVVWLLASQAWRLALWWIGIFSAGMILVVASKLAFMGWGIGIASIDFSGVSGHAMRAGAVMPILGYLGSQGAGQRWRYTAVCSGVVVAVLVALSRVAVHAHSISEVISGAMLGALIGILFIRFAQTGVRPTVSRWAVAATVGGLFVMSSSEPAPTQETLTQIALSLSGRQRPFTRADWISSLPVAPAVIIY